VALEARALRCQGRQRVAEESLPGSRETSIHLDNSVVSAVGIQGVLHIALSDHTDVSDDLDRSGSKHVVFVVGKSLRGSHDDRVTSVCSERVKILHVATNDRVLLSARAFGGQSEQSLTSAASRTTSYSSSFHPFKLFSIKT
jgi:hypothetical protein